MLRHLATLLLSTALALAAAEGGIRLSGLGIGDFVHDSRKLAQSLLLADGGYLAMPPRSSTEIGGHEVRANSLGVRDREPAPAASEALRVLFLGDSVTFGWGVAYEESFPVLLRQTLADEGVAVDVAALPGWNTRSQRAFLEAHIDRYDPDLVVLLYVPNDREPISPHSIEQARATSLRARVYRFAVANSKLAEWLAFALKAYGPSEPDVFLRAYARHEREREAAGIPFAKNDPWWLQSASELRAIRRLLGQRDCQFAVFMLRSRERFGRVDVALERLREFGAATSTHVFDTWPMLADVPIQERYLSSYDQHPNEFGHRLLARGILEELRGSGLLNADDPAPSEDAAVPFTTRSH